MPHTDLSTELALAIRDRIRAVQADLGIADVFYGQHTMIPRSPAVEVKPGAKVRELAGVAAPGGRTLNRLGVVIEVLSAKVGPEETERLDLDRLAQSIEAELHKDTTMGGLISHGFVRDWTPGEFADSRGGMWRTVRMTFIGTSKTYLTTN
jgi:hypothetical protein